MGRRWIKTGFLRRNLAIPEEVDYALNYSVLRNLLITLGLLFIAGCTPPPKVNRPNLPILADHGVMEGIPGKPGGIFVETEPGEPNTFNWFISEDRTSADYIEIFFMPLVTLNPVTNQFEPVLAKSWEVLPDQKNFIFHLREGLQWSDGAPLTADDVVFSFQAVYDKRYPNRNADDLSDDDKPFIVTKINDTTVQIQTPNIFAPFLTKITDVCIMPKHSLDHFYQDGTLQKQWNRSTAQNNPNSIVVSGAYKIFSYHPGERIVLSPNPYYYKTDTAGVRLPYIDFLINKFVKDQNASVIAFASGLTDAEGISPDDVEWVRRSAKLHDFTIYDRGLSAASNFLWFNQNPGKDKDGKPFVDPIKLKWFQDIRFRQAVSYGIDRQGMVDGVLFGRGAPLWSGESPANVKWFNPNVKKYPYDPEKAKSLLAEAGFHFDGTILRDAGGHPVEIDLFTNKENQIRENMATVFQENMKTLGITIHLKFVDFNALIEKLSESYNYEASLLGLIGGFDPSDGISVYLSKGRLHQWYPNQPKPTTPWEARIDELMIAELRTLDESKRKEYYNEVQEIMSEQCAFIYLITSNSYSGLRNKWQNIQIPKLVYQPLTWNREQIWTP